MNKKRSVGTQLLGKEKSGALVAILQVRSEWNAEKNSPESYPGACQVTVHGKLEEGEDFIQALLREIGEELDPAIVPIVDQLSKTGKLVELSSVHTPEKDVITYGAIVEENVLKILTDKPKSRSFGGFRMIRRNEVEGIIDIRTINKETGVTDEKVIAMFPDEKEAVLTAFQKLG